MPVRSRRLLGRYWTVPHLGLTGCVLAACAKVAGSFEVSRKGAWTPLLRSRSTGRPIRSVAAGGAFCATEGAAMRIEHRAAATTALPVFIKAMATLLASRQV